MSGRVQALGYIKVLTPLVRYGVLQAAELQQVIRALQDRKTIRAQDVLELLDEKDVPEDKMDIFAMICDQVRQMGGGINE